MNRLGRASWLALGLVAFVQTAVLGWMVYDRVSLLRQGREIIAEVAPVDPRDLFRGDYVIFSYAFNSSGNIIVPGGVRRGNSVYATLKPKEAGQWEIAKVERAHPITVEPDQVVLKGIVEDVWPLTVSEESTARLRFGIEHYFVPEGTGRDLEKLVQLKKLAVVIAVGRKGDAAIKALVIDGQRLVEEPPL